MPETRTAPEVKSQVPAAGVQSEWDKVLAASRKEGTVSIYTTAGSAGRADITRAFKDKYGINTEFFTSPYILINTDMARDDDFRSYRDVLNPKWKGKIVQNDPTVLGTGFSFFAVVGGLMLGYDYMKQLTAQDPVLLRDRRLGHLIKMKV